MIKGIRSLRSNKLVYIAGGFDLDLLDHNTDMKLHLFFNLMV